MAKNSPSPAPADVLSEAVPEADPNAIPEGRAFWSFTYTGPVEFTDDRSCALCNAVAIDKCSKSEREHGSTPHSCPGCAAAREGFCPNHCGLKEALAHSPQSYHSGGAFSHMSELAEFRAAGMAAVEVHAVCHDLQEGCPDGVLELRITTRK